MPGMGRLLTNSKMVEQYRELSEIKQTNKPLDNNLVFYRLSTGQQT